ncbi:hypothetical protein BCR32DRAFT_287696 [Anaeromyces robustus]|uniref:Uncharacterized protein n=1 Tax=Anaeromyces robustus TaxID=1754192 RepID=A0A1Y1VQD8_9FUNG|nr:hypothetical protein BCR32DRAFT_287696 [Anaeromyces robustus]|eukprot:ORX63522.1 hypothetical protein BCR32DRAFT_287696 [Anaeromyces robustus]
MQFAHIFSEALYVILNYVSFSIYIVTATITFISFFYADKKVLGINRCYIISLLVLWFSLIELVISISTFILNYKKHLSWVKLREQQLQKLASINPTPLKMIPENVIEPVSPIVPLSPISGVADKSVNDNKEGDITVTISHGSSISQNAATIKLQRASQGKNSNENVKGSKNGCDSVQSLNGSISKKSCLSYECIDKTILHYMHDKSVDFANSDPRATENNIKLISILHIMIYIFHFILSILILIVLLFDWKYSLHFLLLYTQTEITIKLQDHFLLKQFIDLSLT